MSKSLAILGILVLCASAIFALSPAEPPAVGTVAPEFTLKTNEGNQASLKDFRGTWVVLYFYPKDFTSGCTLQARNFQMDSEKYKAAKAIVLGISERWPWPLDRKSTRLNSSHSQISYAVFCLK